MRDESDLVPAVEQYRGRAFRMASDVADDIGGDLAILSAGLGYVRAATPIPAYDLTVRDVGPGSIRKRVHEAFDAREWWLAMTRGPFSTNVTEDLDGRPLVLACLSRAYGDLVAEDLLAFSRARPGRLRLFGLSLAAWLPAELRPCLMPYDERLDATGQRGTRTDFAQRALRDFVRNVPPGSVERQADHVRLRMAGERFEPRRRQVRASDDELLRRIERASAAVGSPAGRILRHLRTEQGVSCSQERLRRLMPRLARGVNAA